MFCTYCGKKNPENTEFCVYCGKRIGKAAIVTPSRPAVPFMQQYRGWIVIVGSIFILLGFILPWVSVHFLDWVSTSYSGLTGLFALIALAFASMLGASSTYSGSSSGGGVLVLLSILVLIPCVLILLFGILHLRNGIRMNKTDKTNETDPLQQGSLLKVRSITCIVFLGIYFIVALGLSSVHLGGVLESVLGSIAGGTYLGIGFWMTTIGYVITLVVGENILSEEEKGKIKF